MNRQISRKVFDGSSKESSSDERLLSKGRFDESFPAIYVINILISIINLSISLSLYVCVVVVGLW